MKKLYALAATALFAVAANAQLYITGEGDFTSGTWNPGQPDELSLNAAGNVYSIEVSNLSSFKLSTSFGSWDEFNAGVLGCNYGDTPGVAVNLIQGYSSNISCPWKGDYKIEVAADLSTITLTTNTPNPGSVIPVFIRGGMNSWGAPAEWQFEDLGNGVYKFVCAEGQTITTSQEFKVADADWNKVNYGANEPIILDAACQAYYNGNNMKVTENFNGVFWFVINLNGSGESYVTLSNDKDFVPEWYTAVEKPALYITGNGDFMNGTWNPETPDQFTYIDGEYRLNVNNLSSFKLSTTKGSWDEFNAGVLGCQYGDEPGVAVELIAGYDGDIACPWKGNYTIAVSEDLTTITLTTDTPKPGDEPLPSVDVYLRGGMNGWGAPDDWKFESLGEGVYKFVCAEGQAISPSQDFKIADANWSDVNYGGASNISFETTYTLIFNAGNMTMAEDFNGVCWFAINHNGGDTLLTMSNDKTFVPDWYTPVMVDEVTADKEETVYFNLQGQKVANPSNGIYVALKNGKAVKVAVK